MDRWVERIFIGNNDEVQFWLVRLRKRLVMYTCLTLAIDSKYLLIISIKKKNLQK